MSGRFARPSSTGFRHPIIGIAIPCHDQSLKERISLPLVLRPCPAGEREVLAASSMDATLFNTQVTCVCFNSIP